jgi:deazaflavin-dependent oxidoreductase (nitroreductase family)
MSDRYVRPGWFTTNIFNRIVAGLTGLGLSVWGSRVLEVRGRTSGEPRRVPVNLLTLDGDRYLVAPRGETQWVRNLRAGDGQGTLLLGRRREPFVATELADDEKPRLLRAYLKRWKAEVGTFFEGVGANASDEELRRISPGYPVFRLSADEARPRDEPEQESNVDRSPQGPE